MSLKGWRELPPGGLILKAGNSVKYKTGTWRSIRPVWNKDKCINCFMCWLHCPDGSILVKDNKMSGINYDYCKGCGVCAAICPKSAIEMKPESLFEEGENK